MPIIETWDYQLTPSNISYFRNKAIKSRGKQEVADLASGTEEQGLV